MIFFDEKTFKKVRPVVLRKYCIAERSLFTANYSKIEHNFYTPHVTRGPLGKISGIQVSELFVLKVTDEEEGINYLEIRHTDIQSPGMYVYQGESEFPAILLFEERDLIVQIVSKTKPSDTALGYAMNFMKAFKKLTDLM